MRALPPTTVEQRSSLYGDVETLVTVGFLSHTVQVGDWPVALRTLCPGDLHLFRSRTFKGADADWQVWMLAASIWMVDGYSFLEESNSAWKLHEAIKKFPKSVKDLLFSLVAGLFARQDKAFEALEPWCFEGQSRFRWRALKGLSVGMWSGIPGVEKLGLNSFQQMWRAFNEVEDQRRDDESLWEGFKLVASASAPKGVKKIDQQDRNRRKAEEDRRQMVLDRFYYMTKGIISGKTEKGSDLSEDLPALVYASKDPELLADEMYRWVTGQEDAHDQVVSAYKRQIRERHEAEKAAREARRLELQRKQKELEESGMPNRLIACTAEQLEHMLRDRKPGIRTVVDGKGAINPERLYDKYVAKQPNSGLLQGTADGKVVDPTGVTKEVLQDLVNSRQVPFSVSKEG